MSRPITSTNNYTQFSMLSAELAGEAVSYAVKPGLPGGSEITAAEALAAQHCELPPGGAVLLAGSRSGALALALSRRFNNSLHLLEDHLIAQRCARQTFVAAGKTPAAISSSLELIGVHEQFAAAVLLLPKGRKLARRWLALICQALVPSGVLFLAGANDEGIQSVIQDAAELFGPAAVLAYKKGSRLARLEKRPLLLPAWAGEPGIAPGTWYTFQLELAGKSRQLFNLAGVFSSEHLDPGTALLLEHLKVRPQARVLDVGCGCGVIGLSAAWNEPSAQVEMLDADLTAVAVAGRNLETQGLANCQAYASDLLDACAENRYDMILSNPPFHAGQAVNLQIAEALIEQAAQALKPKGQLWIVANRFLRYDRLMQNHFRQVSTPAQNPQYHLLIGYH